MRQGYGDVVPRAKLRVAGTVHACTPGDGASERVIDAAEMSLERFERAAIEPDLAVREVAVILEDEIGRSLAYKLRERSDGALDVQLEGAAPLEKSARDVEQTDAQAMRPESRMIDRRGLYQLGRTDDSVRDMYRSLDRVHACRFQPGSRPGVQIAPRCAFQRGQEILQVRVAERVLAEIRLDAFEECLLADPSHELLQRGCSLVVGDEVEVERDGLDVRDVRDDRMGGRKLVLPACTIFGGDRKLDPGGFESRGLSRRQVSRVLREAFVEP